MKIVRKDHTLDRLLDLHGQVLVINDAGYWVRFVAHRVPCTPDKPHGLDYAITLHDPRGARLVGFDNAHPVRGGTRAARVAKDHRHRMLRIAPYDFTTADELVAAFWKEVESIMKELGAWP
jgi:hypothetical protein